MSYSFTEKKRIRKSFAKRANVLEVPFLLATQLDSYTQFLQMETPYDQRADVGLQAAFQSIFPIISHYEALLMLHHCVHAFVWSFWTKSHPNLMWLKKFVKMKFIWVKFR